MVSSKALNIPYQDILDTMIEGCQLIDHQWRYCYLNDTAVAHSRLSREDLLGRTMMEVYPGIETTPLFAVLRQCMDESRAYRMENTFVYPDGETAWFELSIQPRPEGLFILSIDITSRKRLELALMEEQRVLESQVAKRTQELEISNQALQQAKNDADMANQAKSIFLSRMSHELRTPLNAILGFAQVLQMELADVDHQASLHHILKGGRHLLTLINEVLDLARIEIGQISLSPEPVSLQLALMEVVDSLRPLATTRAISISIEFGSIGEYTIHTDRQQLKQVLINLISNAIKYNHDHGHIRITGTRVDERIHLAISDTGIGIPLGRLSELFLPFERLGQEYTMIEGSGLGLVIAKHFIELMNGTIEVSSEVGVGTTFVISFPAAVEPVSLTETAVQPIVGLVVSRPITILLIEDNLSDFHLMERLFRSTSGITLLTAMQGKHGVELAKEHRPDLILLDLHLPDTHGENVLQCLLADPATQGIPVVIITADATARQIERLRKSGARAYLTKPLDIALFLDTIRKVLLEE